MGKATVTDDVSTKRQNWTSIGLRFLFMVGVSVAVLATHGLDDGFTLNFTELAIVSGIGMGMIVVLSLSVWVSTLKNATPFLILGTDAVLAGGYAYLSNGEPLILIGTVCFLAVSTTLHLGVLWGSLDGAGTLTIALGTSLYLMIAGSPDQSLDTTLALELYMLPVLVSALVVAGAVIWTEIQSGHHGKAIAQLDKTVRSSVDQLNAFRERNRAIAEMTIALSSTLDYKRVLNAALDVGQLSMRPQKGQWTVGIVLLFQADESSLYVASSRGLKPTDEHVTVSATKGLIAEALETCEPTIAQNMSDPEMHKFVGLNGIRSLVCVPLHAHYDNFGVLVYGSSQAKAFVEDALDILRVIGVQTTTALQNAALYQTLRDERDMIFQLEEDARKSLVRDLHDIPTQTISAVTMRLTVIKRMVEKALGTIPEDLADELNTTEAMARRSTEEIRHVLFKLRPLALETQGLAAALEQLAEKMVQTYKQPCTVKIHPDVETYLDEAKQGVMFYLVEEAVNNARKYAKASMITVQAALKNEMVILRIADNGIGFDVNATKENYTSRGSFGLVNMRERAEMLDGMLDMKSVKGRGTTITVTIPIDHSRLTTTGTYAQVPKTKFATVARNRSEQGF